MSNTTSSASFPSFETAVKELLAAKAATDAKTAEMKALAAQVKEQVEEAAEQAAEAVTEAAEPIVEVAKAAKAAATTDEAKAFYAAVGQLGLNVARSSISHAVHGLLLAVSWAVWLADVLLTWGVYDAPRLVSDVRAMVRSMVALAQPDPLALPWSDETPTFLDEAAQSLGNPWAEWDAWPELTTTDWVIWEAQN